MATDTDVSAFRRVWIFISHSLTLFIVGVIVSIGIGYFFYYKGLSDAVTEAKKSGYADGHAKGGRWSDGGFKSLQQ